MGRITYVPAITSGKFVHGWSVRADSDSDLSSMTGDVKAKTASWANAARPEMEKARIERDVNEWTEYLVSGLGVVKCHTKWTECNIFKTPK